MSDPSGAAHSTYENWLTLAKAIALYCSAAIAVAGFGAGLYEYFNTFRHQRESEQQAAIRESQKPYLDHEISLYFEACDVTAKIATEEKSADDRGKAETRFWQLYWGELVAVEDPGVEAAMVVFGDARTANASNEELQPKALQVACAARKSLAQRWGFPFEPSGSC